MVSTLLSYAAQSAESAEQYLSLQAAASILPTHIASAGPELAEITAEGYPGNRYHSCTPEIDQIELLTIDYAKNLFGADHANVQPLSCSAANIASMSAMVPRGGKILSMDLHHGGHISHGSKTHISSALYEFEYYGSSNGLIDYDQVRDLTKKYQPHLIICGASSYPREISYKIFREVADEFGALLLADISHIAGLVASGFVESPIKYAHVTTTSTYKQLYGPRGGLILLGPNSDAFHETGIDRCRAIDRALFPGLQGTPDYRQILQKGLALEAALSLDFRNLMQSVVELAKVLSSVFMAKGLKLIGDGTDTHMVLVDLCDQHKTGKQIEEALSKIGILANRNLIPNDSQPPSKTSGIRFGTNTAAYRRISAETMQGIANTICDVIARPNHNTREKAAYIKDICERFPILRCA